MLLYTYISRFPVNPHYQQQLYLRPSFIAFFNFSHKWPTFAFTSESGYTLAFAQRIAHSGLHAETRAFQMGVVSLPSERSARSQTSPGRVSERRTLPLLGLGRVCSRRRRGPAGLRDFFRFCRNCGLHALRSVLSECARRGVVSLPSACSACC